MGGHAKIETVTGDLIDAGGAFVAFHGLVEICHCVSFALGWEGNRSGAGLSDVLTPAGVSAALDPDPQFLGARPR